MAVHLQTELEILKKDLLKLGGKVEEIVGEAVLAVKKLDGELAKKVIEKDHEIDLKEVDVEEQCLKVLALHQPVAVDLRFIVSAMKINNDLERVGDLAVNIAERALFLSGQPQISIPFDFDTMVEKTRNMLKKSLDSLVQMDAQLADQVCHEDQLVDDIHRKMYAKVYREIRKAPEHTETLIHYLSISKHLERVADYATNISEDVIYMIEGAIVRHNPEIFYSVSDSDESSKPE